MARCEDCVHYEVCIIRRLYGRKENCGHFNAPHKRRRRSWQYDRYNGEYFCTGCGEYALQLHKIFTDDYELTEDFLSNYCPNCGAKMDGDASYPKDQEEAESFAEYLFSQGLTLGDLERMII